MTIVYLVYGNVHTYISFILGTKL